MTSLSRDARYFVDGVTKYLRGTESGNVILPRVTAAFQKITSSSKNQKSALVASAIALSAKEKAEIEKMVSRLLSHEVTLQCRVDRVLIGGLRIQVGDWIVDTSLNAQIDGMKEFLVR